MLKLMGKKIFTILRSKNYLTCDVNVLKIVILFISSLFSDGAHKEWANVGIELRRLADNFMKTKERKKVKEQAYGVSIYVDGTHSRLASAS